MKLLVCGGRHYSDSNKLFAVLDEIHSSTPIDCIVTGGANGADRLGLEWAVAKQVVSSVVPAQWRKFGNQAGPLRNSRMLAMHPDIDLVVAAPGGAGTDDMVEKAKAHSIPVRFVESEAKDA